MKRVAIVQARMASTRLPGKVLADVAGRPLLVHVLERLKRCRAIDEIMVATTDQPDDEPLVELARGQGVAWFRGSHTDVLTRTVAAARAVGADVVVRVTADCPLVDPQVTERVIRELTANSYRCDYASNVLERTWPRGLDVEALPLDTLLRIDRLASSPAAREHVTVLPRSERPELFLRRSVVDGERNDDLRWTVDVPRDLELIRRLFSELDLADRPRPYRQILAYVRARPELVGWNAGIETWDPCAAAPRA